MHAHRLLPFLAAAALAVLLAGCSQMSVRHLDRAPWSTGGNETLSLKFWRFEYAVEPQADRFRITGRAYPVKETLPEWVDWIDELWMAAYISDASGKVLADDLHVYLPGPLDAAKGVPIDFTLKPGRIEDGRLFLTFGYRMALGRGKSSGAAPDPNRRQFFANERAVEIF